jgi:glutaredoxin
MTVTVYTTSQCAICHSLMLWLDQEKVSYKRVIVDEDEKGMEELVSKTGGAAGVPFTAITKDDNSEEVIFGFNRMKIKTALGIG